MPQRLADEERVARGDLGDLASEFDALAFELAATGQRQILENVGRAQTRQHHPLDARLASQVSHHVGQRVGPVEIGGAKRAHHEDWRIAQPAHEVAQQQQARPVGPVEVVEHEHDWALRRLAAQQVEHGLEEP